MQDLKQYNATVGHLINHSKKPNVWFGMVDHIRFGKIRSIVMLKDVSANQELFVSSDCTIILKQTWVLQQKWYNTLLTIEKKYIVIFYLYRLIMDIWSSMQPQTLPSKPSSGQANGWLTWTTSLSTVKWNITFIICDLQWISINLTCTCWRALVTTWRNKLYVME